jgi:adenosine deaminase
MTINLHCHLEGCVRPSTAAELAVALGVPQPPGGWEDALVMRSPADLTVFLAHVAAAYPLLGSYEALERVAREAVIDAAADGTRFLELRFGPLTHVREDFGARDAIRAVCEGAQDGARSSGIATGVVVCVLRHHDEQANVELARAAATLAGDGVVGFDVAGDELLFPSLEPYVRPFQIAAAAGLGLTAHVAEAGPAENIRAAHDVLGVHRIGHGTHLSGDDQMLEWSVDHGMCLEVCPTSNVLTGVATSVRAHPVHRFLEAGCDVVLGDDDPVTTGSSLGDEVRRLREAGLTDDQLARIDATAAEVAFCTPTVRELLRTGRTVA